MEAMEEEGRQLASTGTNLNLVAAASGSGHGGCPEGIPVEIGLLSILAAFGVAFGVLYMALTLTTAARRKRSADDNLEELEIDSMCETDSVQDLIGCGVRKFARGAEASISFKFADLVWHGELGYSDCLGVSCLLS